MSLLTLLLLVLAGSEAPEDEDRHSTPEERYRALASDYESAYQAFIKADREAKTKEDRDALAALPGLNARNFSGGFMSLAAGYPGSTAAEDALIWVGSHTFQTPDSEEAKRRLARDHARSAKLGPVLGFQGHYGAGIEGSEAFFREVLAKNPHREIQGLASYWLARHLLAKAADARSARNDPGSRRYGPQSPFLVLNGADWPDRLRRLDPDAIEREAESLLERVAELYADVPHNDKRRKPGPLGEAAGFYLHELRDLAVGKVAPEVEGIDLDGRRFRLADYRGKVVVLDFGSHFYCGTCRAMYPRERALVKKLEGRPFALVTIDADPDLDPLKAAWRVEGNPWRCVWDGGWDGPNNTAWNIQEYPTIYVLDHRGVIRYKSAGDPGEVLDRVVDGLVSALESSTR